MPLAQVRVPLRALREHGPQRLHLGQGRIPLTSVQCTWAGRAPKKLNNPWRGKNDGVHDPDVLLGRRDVRRMSSAESKAAEVGKIEGVDDEAP